MATRQPSKQARFEVLLEKMQSDIRVVAEGHSGLKRQLGEVRDELKQQMGLLETVVRDGFQENRLAHQRFEERIGRAETAISEGFHENRLAHERFEEHLAAHTA